MKRLTITALLVLTATVANANEYSGKDAVKIISKGKIMMERELNRYAISFIVLLKDDEYSCQMGANANGFEAICAELIFVN